MCGCNPHLNRVMTDGFESIEKMWKGEDLQEYGLPHYWPIIRWKGKTRTKQGIWRETSQSFW